MTENRPSTTGTLSDAEWFGGRRWTGIAAVGVVIVLALSAVLIYAAHGNEGTTTSTDPTPATGIKLHSAASLPTALPATAPAATWSIYQTVALPTVTGAGPQRVTGAIATGYAHTPTGALSALANEGFRYQLASDQQWRRAAQAMLAPGPGTDAWIATRAKVTYGSAGAAGGVTLSQVAGFQFVSYTPSDAVIQIVTRNSDGSLQVGSDHVNWDGTDWRYVPALDGGQAANLQSVASLAGFIEWRGV